MMFDPQVVFLLLILRFHKLVERLTELLIFLCESVIFPLEITKIVAPLEFIGSMHSVGSTRNVISCQGVDHVTLQKVITKKIYILKKGAFGTMNGEDREYFYSGNSSQMLNLGSV